MEQSTRRTMPPGPWLLLLCLATAATGGVLQARAQPDSKGFISIDCGLPGETSYVDDITKLTYAPDAGFTDAGTNHNVSVEYVTPQLSRRYLNLRSFPDGKRSCYTLRSLVSGLKYLIRADFKYGNYDGLHRPPVFDLHIGVNFWKTVNISKPGNTELVEAIVVVPDDFVQVCLVNTGAGTPFISGLDLRPLKKTLYPQATAAQGLVLLGRKNFALTDAVIRYPDDPHDRVWFPWASEENYAEISTTKMVHNADDDPFEAPTAVMQTAITPRNASQNIEFFWDPEPTPRDPSPGYIAIMHFAELQVLPSNVVRQFYINLNGEPSYPRGYTPPYLNSDATYNTDTDSTQESRYNISINATVNSTLPPIINAHEVFSVIPTTIIGTDSQEVSAITAIKAKYQVQSNWMGDPCVPKTMAWDRLTCSYAFSSAPTITSVNLSFSGLNGDISHSFSHLKAVQYLDLSNNNLTGSVPDALSELTSLTVLAVSAITAIKAKYQLQMNWMGDPCLPKTIAWDRLNCSHAFSSAPRITRVNLSFSGLNGDISHSFSHLKAVQYLDLSNNNLTGSVPDALSELTSLTVLDLSGNQLNGSIPSGLLKRIQDGSLNLTYGNNPNLCTDGNSCQPAKTKRNSKLAIYIAVPIVLVVAIVSVTVLLFCLLRRKKQGSTNTSVKPQNETASSVTAEAVYGDNSLRLESRRFTYKELEMITNSFQRVLGQGGFGYVYDGFLENGTQVAVKLRSHSSNQGVKEFLAEAQILTRIHHKNLVSLIGYCKDGEYMALVYEYMSEGTLQEHIAVSNHNGGRSLTWRQRLRIALESAQGLEYLHKGTLGYVDPEYQAMIQPSTKSDVYSFGVVLLELVTGKPAILRETVPVSIIQWARQRLARGNIEGMVDARMGGGYDVNAVWKAADIALKCTMQASAQRPTMTDVVLQLQECIELEEGRVGGGGDASGGFYTSSSGDDSKLSYDAYAAGQSTDISQSSAAFEMEYDLRRVPTMATGPAVR